MNIQINFSIEKVPQSRIFKCCPKQFHFLNQYLTILKKKFNVSCFNQPYPALPFESECLKTYFLLAKPQLSKLKLDIPKLGLGNEEGFETPSKKGRVGRGFVAIQKVINIYLYIKNKSLN